MSGNVVVLTGGVGGAKLVDGLYRVLPTGGLTAVVNTGDDFRHFGLPISPDLDTLLYTLSEKANRQLGWGREGETWSFMTAVKSLGGDDWFSLGDGDLALHVLRGAMLASGEPLSAIIARFASAWALELDILPMSDDPVATWVDAESGSMPFQKYFVEQQCRPIVQAIRFVGATEARPGPGVIEAIGRAEAILLAPSNPWLSMDPILAIPAIRDALVCRRCPCIAVSPLVEGQAVKGPTGKIMKELGLDVTNQSIADHYAGLIDGLVVHGDDDAPTGCAVSRTDTLMRDVGGRQRVARVALALAAIGR